jgi:hypothetical protein
LGKLFIDKRGGALSQGATLPKVVQPKPMTTPKVPSTPSTGGPGDGGDKKNNMQNYFKSLMSSKAGVQGGSADPKKAGGATLTGGAR